jgi:hypothetical protein
MIFLMTVSSKCEGETGLSVDRDRLASDPYCGRITAKYFVQTHDVQVRQRISLDEPLI